MISASVPSIIHLNTVQRCLIRLIQHIHPHTLHPSISTGTTQVVPTVQNQWIPFTRFLAVSSPLRACCWCTSRASSRARSFVSCLWWQTCVSTLSLHDPRETTVLQHIKSIPHGTFNCLLDSPPRSLSLIKSYRSSANHPLFPLPLSLPSPPLSPDTHLPPCPKSSTAGARAATSRASSLTAPTSPSLTLSARSCWATTSATARTLTLSCSRMAMVRRPVPFLLRFVL